MDNQPLAGLNALVTGGARGIGLAIATRLVSDGARVAIGDLDGAEAERAARSLPTTEFGPNAGFALDVANYGVAQEAVDRMVSAMGSIDILVNNAGVGVMEPALEMSPDAFEQVLKVNLVGAFAMAQAAARHMIEQGDGRIINISSIAGHRGGENRAAYGASKAGLELMTRVLALELGGRGVTANAVAPGPVDTELTRQAHTDAHRANFHQLIPGRRYGSPEEIAAGVAFLARPDASYVNGHTLAVDGGFNAVGIGIVPQKEEAG